MRLGPFIKARRAQLGLALEAVARQSGVSKPAINDLELEHTVDPKCSTVLGLAKGLRVKPEKLLAAVIESLRARP